MTTGSGDFSFGSAVWPGLSKLIEEAGEVLQVAGKLMQTGGKLNHWSGDLGPKLIEELGDLSAAIEFFIVANQISQFDFLDRRTGKLEQFWEWHLEGGAAVGLPE